jgi:CheY-like chemotaxis protein
MMQSTDETNAMNNLNTRIFFASEPENRVCNLLWESLNLSAARIVRCGSTKALLEELDQRQIPHIVLVHTALGGSRVFDFCRIFKNRFPTVPLLLIAEQIEPGVRHWAIQQGAIDLLSIATEKDRQALIQRLPQLLKAPRIHSERLSAPAHKTTEFANMGSEISVAAAVAVLNQISKISSQYLGKLVITNYWQTSRDELSSLSRFLNGFAVEFGRDIHFKESREWLTKEEAVALQRWVRAFIERGQKVVQDLPELLLAAPLNTEQRAVLNLR